MRHARASGFPVPHVFAVEGNEIVMERVDGRSMLEDLAMRPHRLHAHAKLLAELHEELHSIMAPSWLDSRFGDARALLHLDLHPGNVILGASAPWVIDWTNAAAGPPAADVAQTCVLVASSVVPGHRWQRAIGTLGRRLFLRAFLKQFDCRAIHGYLPAVARARLVDENVQQAEQEVINRLLADFAPTQGENS